MIFRVFAIFRVFSEIFYHKNSHFSTLKYPYFSSATLYFANFIKKHRKNMHFVDYTTTKKCEKNNINIEKKEKLEKRKKRTPYIYKACALLSVICNL